MAHGLPAMSIDGTITIVFLAGAVWIEPTLTRLTVERPTN